MGATQQVISGQDKAFDYANSALIKAQDYLDALYATAAAAAAQSPAEVNGMGLADADLKAKILQFLDTDLAGFPAAVQQMKRDKVRERTSQVMRDTVRQISRRASAAGWEQPPGAMFASIAQAEQAAAMEVAAQTRELEIEEARLMIDNWRTMLNMEKELVIADSSITGEKVRLILSTMQSKFGYLMEAAKAGATISAQELASALSIMNVNASISSSSSMGLSSSINTSYDGGEGQGLFVIPGM